MSIISAISPDQAIKRVIQIVNKSLERSTLSVEPFQEAEFLRSGGVLYVIGFELQLFSFLMCRWRPNEDLGVLWTIFLDGLEKTA
jgi:hypothetical protein